MSPASASALNEGGIPSNKQQVQTTDLVPVESKAAEAFLPEAESIDVTVPEATSEPVTEEQETAAEDQKLADEPAPSAPVEKQESETVREAPLPESDALEASTPTAEEPRNSVSSLDGNGNIVATSPSANTSIIKVTKRDVRTSPTAVGYKYAEGARFRLYKRTMSWGQETITEITAAWGTCQIQATDNGICYFSVPNTNSNNGNRDAQFYVREIAPAAGTPAAANYDMIDTFNTGENGVDTTPRQYRTPAMRANMTYDIPSQATSPSSNGGNNFWANPIKNPSLPLRCESGIRVAMLFDLSNSVPNAYASASLGEAGKSFVDALAGTQSSVALYSFGTASPYRNTSNHTNLRSTLLDADVTTLKNQIQQYVNALPTPNNGGNYGGTNWDEGFWKVAENSANYDLVVVLTDGNPTFSGPGGNTGPGNSTHMRELERAIASANAIKDKGTRVIPVGIGAGLNADHNLRSISGPNKYVPGASLNTADYVNVSWEALDPLLRDFAQAISCEADLVVTKMVKDLQGQTSPAEGWAFNASINGVGAMISPEVETTTNEQGQIDYDLAFTTPTGSSTVDITETQQDGYTFESAVCTVNGQTRQVTQSEQFQLLLTVGDNAECTVVNAMVPSSLDVSKSSNPVSGTEVQPGEEVEYFISFEAEGHFPMDVAYVDHLTGVLDDADFIEGSLTAGNGLNAVRSGNQIAITGSIEPGETVVVSYKVKVKTEDFTDGWLRNFVRPAGEQPPTECLPEDPLCTEHPIPGELTVGKSSDPGSGQYVAPGETVDYTLTFDNSGASEVEVNYVDHLVDVLDDAEFVEGSLVASNGLSAVRNGNQITITGDLPKESTATVTYSVTVKTAEFGNGIARNFLVPEGETPPEECEPEDPNCTEHPILGSVIWEKVDEANNLLEGSEWKLTGPDGAVIEILDCTVEPCTGADSNPNAGKFQVTGLEWGQYTLVETKAPAGYLLNEKEFDIDIQGDIEPAKLLIDLGQITNEQREGLALPLTGGLGTDEFLIGGGIALVAALGIIAWNRRKGAAEVVPLKIDG
ncbi:SpaA isopeptide-forming pilin-related protein [Glutamicibacter uratoxydans]|uniref:DUF7927 domain-containing protein n=1 Tax=Glutamicibacter uratoxydans TaxID=43667 RepID=UPI003D6EF732